MPDPVATPSTPDPVYSTIGLRDVVIAEVLTDPENGNATFGAVEPLVAAIDFQVSNKSGDPDVQYYDDHEGDTLYKDPELEGTFEMADIPPRMQAKLLNRKIDDFGVVVHNAGDKPKYFAMGFKSAKANGKDRYAWYYKGRASIPDEKYTTKKGKDITRQTTKLKMTFIKLTSNGNARAYVDEDEEDFATKKDTFFSSVYVPTFTPSNG